MATIRRQVVVVAAMLAVPGAVTGQGQPFKLELLSTREAKVPIVVVDVTGTASRAAILDTGSPLFWLPVATKSTVAAPPSAAVPCPPPVWAPQSTAGAADLGRTSTFAYGGGYMTGPEYNVTLTLLDYLDHGVSTPNVGITAATTVGFGSIGCDVGILGVDQASQTAPRIFAAQGINSLFSVELACPAQSIGTALSGAGTATFGAVNASAVVGRRFENVNLLPVGRRHSASGHNPQGVTPTSTHWWQFGVTSVAVGRAVSDSGPSLQAIADTGTYGIVAGPGARFVALCAVAPDCSNFSALQDLTITLAGGATVTLSPEDYVMRNSATSCVSQVATLNDIPSDLIVLGDPFFWKHTVVFDYANGGQVRFGVRVNPAPCSYPGASPSNGGNNTNSGGGGGGGSKKKLSAGAIVGVFLAVVVLVLLVAIFSCFAYHERNAQSVSYMKFEAPLEPLADPPKEGADDKATDYADASTA